MSEPISAPIPFRDSEDESANDPTTIAAINARFKKGTERMNRFEHVLGLTNSLLGENTRMTRVNTEMTEDVHEILMFAKSGILTLGKIGSFLARWGHRMRKAVMWAAPPIAAVVAGYHALKAWAHWGS